MSATVMPIQSLCVSTKDDWRGDWISGQFNNDTIHGSNREDLLFGGEGNDTISGGAASDIILGDANYFPSVRTRVNEAKEFNWKSNVPYDAGIGLPLPVNFAWEKGIASNQPEKERAYMDFGKTRIVLQQGIRLNSDEYEQTAASGSYDDTIDGGAGNDWIDGQRGHDTITGGTGSDYS